MARVMTCHIHTERGDVVTARLLATRGVSIRIGTSGVAVIAPDLAEAERVLDDALHQVVLLKQHVLGQCSTDDLYDEVVGA